jgi:hypothetical protein
MKILCKLAYIVDYAASDLSPRTVYVRFAVQNLVPSGYREGWVITHIDGRFIPRETFPHLHGDASEESTVGSTSATHEIKISVTGKAHSSGKLEWSLR